MPRALWNTRTRTVGSWRLSRDILARRDYAILASTAFNSRDGDVTWVYPVTEYLIHTSDGFLITRTMRRLLDAQTEVPIAWVCIYRTTKLEADFMSFLFLKLYNIVELRDATSTPGFLGTCRRVRLRPKLHRLLVSSACLQCAILGRTPSFEIQGR